MKMEKLQTDARKLGIFLTDLFIKKFVVTKWIISEINFDLGLKKVIGLFTAENIESLAIDETPEDFQNLLQKRVNELLDIRLAIHTNIIKSIYLMNIENNILNRIHDKVAFLEKNQRSLVEKKIEEMIHLCFTVWKKQKFDK